jgi:hypothetical protein
MQMVFPVLQTLKWRISLLRLEQEQAKVSYSLLKREQGIGAFL